MPDPGNSYNLRSYGLYKLQPETPIYAKDAKLIVDDVISTIIGYKTLVSGIIVPVSKGQIITHNGVAVSLLDVGTNGRILIANSAAPDGIEWVDPSSLGFMTALEVQEAGVVIGSRQILNYLNTGNVAFAVTDNAGNQSVDVEASVTFPSQTLFSKSTVDQTTTSTSSVNITNLSLSIAANQTIYFRAVLHVGTSANNGGRYAVTIPTGATMKVMVTGQTTNTIAAGVGGGATQWLTTSGTQTATIHAITQANQNAVLEGWVTASSTAGSIQIQGASASVANTVTYYSGSFITGHVV